MNRHSDKPEDFDKLREKIIGLGERSVKKSYYPRLQQQLQELERAEERFRQLSRRYELILQSAGEGIFGLDVQGNYTFMNKAAAAMLGYKEGELLGKHSHSCIHYSRPDGSPYPEEECRTYAAFWEGRVIHVDDECFCRKDGSQFPVEYTSTPIMEDGEILGSVVTFSDISERRKAEEALKESEWRLEFATSLANEAIWDWDLVADRITRNEVYVKMFGRPPEAGDSAGWWRGRIHPEDRDRVVAAFTAIVSGKQDEMNVEYRFMLADGNWAHVHDRAKVIRSSEGKPLRMIGTMLNITERKQAENRIRESEKNLRTILDSVYDAIFIHDVDGTILDVNTKMLEMYRVDREQALRSKIVEDFSAAENPLDKVPDLWSRAIGGEEQLFEWKARRPNDGSVFDVEVFLRKITLQAKDVILASVRDITERKRAEEALRISEANYREIFESVNDAIFVHDIDTGEVLSTNRKTEEMFGYPHGEFRKFIDETLFSGLPGYTAQDAMEKIRLAAAGSPQLFEWMSRRKNGELFWVEVNLKRAVIGGETRLLAVVREISERKRAEQELRKTKEQLEEAQQIAGIGNWEWDVAANTVTWSDEVYRIFNVPRGEFKGTYEAFMELVHPEDRAGIEKSLAEAANERKETTFNEYRIIRPDGTIRTIYTRLKLGYNRAGEIISTRGTAQDVTEARRAEETLKLTQFSVDHASVSAFIIARDARILYANEQACRGLGYSREELLSMTIPDLDPNFPHSRWGDHWEQLKKEVFLHFESMHRRKDGVLVPMDISVNYLSFGGREYNIGFALDISERKRAENELRLSYSLNKTIIDSVNDAISLIDVRDFTIVAANNVFLKNYGYSDQAEIVGKHCYEITHHRSDMCSAPDDICPLVETVKTKDHFSVDHVHYDKQGTKIYVEVSTSPIRDEAGNVVQVVHVQRNITERKEAEEALRVSESRFRNLFKQSSISMQIFAPDGRTLEVNHAWEELWGLKLDEIKDYNVLHDTQLVDKGIMPYIQKGFAGEAAEIPITGYDPSEIGYAGRARWVKAFIYPVKGAGDQIREVVLMHWDVTEMVKAQEALQESEERFRTFFELAAVGTTQLDPATTKFARTNQRFCDMTGYTCQELRSMTFNELTHPEDRTVDEQAFAKMLEPGMPTFETEKRYIRKDGGIIWVHVWAAVVHDRRGRPLHTAAIVQDITDRKRMEDEIRHMAHHDMLTGLPNRRLFNEIAGIEMAQAERNHKKLAVLFLDLDRFKEINDTLGHEAGDQLLKEVAARLKSVLRKSDSIGRIGGDEFSIILADIGRPDTVSDIARKIVDSFRKPFMIAVGELKTTTSVGISIFPDDGKEIDTLLRYADMAMYNAKESGRNTYRFYDPSINIRSIERARLEQMLRRSVELGEMVLYYLPQIDVTSGKVICAEALVRWRHPERGLLLPKDFIPEAEESGFIKEIDEWVLSAVCRQIRSWQDSGYRPVCVSVNLSSSEFQSADLAKKIEAILKETGTAAEFLHIELSESMAMSDVKHTRAVMSKLAAMGVHFSLDGFGTGYSSLNHLKRMPVEKLKIDKSFIRDIAVDRDDRAIIEAATAMAHSLKIKVIAQGVETEEQLSFLKQSHCDEAQGFLFSRPVPAEKMTELISTR